MGSNSGDTGMAERLYGVEEKDPLAWLRVGNES